MRRPKNKPLVSNALLLKKGRNLWMREDASNVISKGTKPELVQKGTKQITRVAICPMLGPPIPLQAKTRK
jgi:hypothetical protein